MGRAPQEWLSFVKVEFQNNHTIKGLFEHIEAIELELKISKEDEQEAVRKYGEAELNIDRLIDNCAQLTKKNQALMAEIDGMKYEVVDEPEKVPLPKEVAEALDSFKAEGRDIDYIIEWLVYENKYDMTISQRIISLKEYARNNGRNLISALVNGYTVEKTKEERLREGLDSVVREWCACPTRDGGTTKELVNGLTDFVTKFNADNG